MRYNYGKEGSRKDYTPYSCLKIISTTPGVVRDRLGSQIIFTSSEVNNLNPRQLAAMGRICRQRQLSGPAIGRAQLHAALQAGVGSCA